MVSFIRRTQFCIKDKVKALLAGWLLLVVSFAYGEDVNAIAERYVKLVLALGEHDPDYVDAYYGPAEWRVEARAKKATLDQIRAEGDAILAAIPAAHDLRTIYLRRQTESLLTRVD